MAITYDVCLLPDDTAGYSHGASQDALQTSLNLNYQVIVTDPADPNFDPGTVSAFDVLGAPGLPIVNLSVYYENGLVIPYLMCRDKQASRDPSARGKWIVRTRWDTGDRAGGSEQVPQEPPVSLDSIAPIVETILGEDELIRYSDKTGKNCLTPTKNMFDSPFIEKLGTEIRRVTQYEATEEIADWRNRKFALNSNIYRTEPAHSWMITDVEWVQATVQLQAGPTTAWQVSYTMELSVRPALWLDERALIDSHWYDFPNGNRKTPFIDEVLKTYITAPVDVDGNPLPLTSMHYDSWRMQDEISFAFLKA